MSAFRIFFLIAISPLILTHSAFAQVGKELDVFIHPKKFYQKFFPHLKIKKAETDTLYIKSYPNYLTVGVHLIRPTIYLDMISKSSLPNASDVSSNFRTNIGNIVAFSVSYRFITAGFAVIASSSSKNKDSYAGTKYRTATIKYNAAAYYLQFKFIRTRGYTDINTYNSSNTMKNYIKRDDILTKEFQFECIYNFQWKKYSYYAPIDYTYRQLKSSAGMLLKAGVYYNELSADSNLLSLKQRPAFEGFNNIVTITTTSFKVAPGVGGNLVFLKRFYLAGALFTPYNLYLYNYYTTNHERIHKGNGIALVLDANISLGYQSERFYTGLRYQADTKSVTLNAVEMNTILSYVALDVGYRFKAPKVVKKVYKATMPPGM